MTPEKQDKWTETSLDSESSLTVKEEEGDEPRSHPPKNTSSEQELSHRLFRQLCYAETSGPQEVLVRLRELCQSWLNTCTKEEILEHLIVEQFLTMLPEETGTWVQSQRPKSGEEIVALVEDMEHDFEKLEKVLIRTEDVPQKGTTSVATLSVPPLRGRPSPGTHQAPAGDTVMPLLEGPQNGFPVPQVPAHTGDQAVVAGLSPDPQVSALTGDQAVVAGPSSDPQVPAHTGDQVVVSGQTLDPQVLARIEDRVLVAGLLQAMFLEKVKFDDVVVYFLKEEWSVLDSTQRALYKEVTLENFRHIIFLAKLYPRPLMISALERITAKLEAQESPQGLALNGDEVRVEIETPTTVKQEISEESPATESENVQSNVSDQPEVSTSSKQTAGWNRQLGSPTAKRAKVEERDSGEEMVVMETETTTEQTDENLGEHSSSNLSIDQSIPKEQEIYKDNEQLEMKEERVDKCEEGGEASSLMPGPSQNQVMEQKFSSENEQTQEYNDGSVGGLHGISHSLMHQMIHTDQNPNQYNECGETSSHMSAFNPHVNIQARPNHHECNQCGRIFTRKGNLVDHLRIHTGERPFSCTECEKTFSRNRYLVQHQRVHEKGKLFECKECGKSFSGKKSFVSHQRIHKGKKLHECKDCGESFARSRTLLVHQKIHSGEKEKYECEVCGKIFARNKSLIEHVKIHTGEKPYACDQCGKTFLRKSYVAIHYRIHSKEKPYVCQVCGEAFTWSSGFARHRLTHTEQEYNEMNE